MFRSERQQCDAIRALLRPAQLDFLWTESGPTPQACKYLKGNPLSSGEDICGNRLSRAKVIPFRKGAA